MGTPQNEINRIPDQSPLKNITLLPYAKNLSVFLGGTNGTGRTTSKEMALAGYRLAIGSRHEDKFDSLSREIELNGGVLPMPFIAEVQSEEQVDNAYNRLGVVKNEPVNLFAFSAGGLEAYMEEFNDLLQAYRERKAPDELREIYIKTMKRVNELVMLPETQKLAMEVNYHGLVKVANKLKENGNLTKDSVIVSISSSESDEYDVNGTDADYKGPAFYLPIAKSKALGQKALEKIAEEVGCAYINLVCPQIDRTGVSKFIDILVKVLQKIKPLGAELPEFPRVSQQDAAKVLLAELSSTNQERYRKIYVLPGGLTSRTRPADWKFKQELLAA